MANTYLTTELVKEFSLTARTLRYYEEMNLLAPERINGQRYFSKRDRTRLKLIIRGKRFGLNLYEIANILGPADVNKSEQDQLIDAIKMGQHCLEMIEQKRREYEILEQELQEYGDACHKRLEELRVIHLGENTCNQ